MTGRRIGQYAVAVHEENGDSVWYGPGDVPTAEHAALITNPKAWADEPEAVAPTKPVNNRKAAKAEPDEE